MGITIMVTLGKRNDIVTTKYNHNEWFVAVVEKIIVESPMVKSFYFHAPHELHHLAGQHYELRLTAENGYQATRVYSVASASNGDSLLQLTIMNVPDGEVSPYISEQLKVGDEVEIRGPFGKFFVWTSENTRPVLLIGGGSGVVPMHAFLSVHATSNSDVPMRLLYSARRYDDILYKDTFLNNENVHITLTQDEPVGWTGDLGRINESMVRNVLEGLDGPVCYICGMSAFVDAASNLLIELGIPAKDILTERFG